MKSQSITINAFGWKLLEIDGSKHSEAFLGEFDPGNLNWSSIILGFELGEAGRGKNQLIT